MAEIDRARQDTDPLVGQVVGGRFTVLEPIARGGSGRVYRALQLGLDRVVALKILAPGSAEAQDPSAVKRFFLEAQIASRLAHPSLVAIHDSGRTDDGAFYLAMEYVEGQTLAEELAGGPLSTSRAVSIALQLCDGLAQVHRFGLVHCDVKPSNVVLSERSKDVVKLLDFGAARFASPADFTSQSGAGVGSPLYMAPEQARGERPDARTDVYAMGVLLYEMVTGRPPFTGGSHLEILLQHAREPVRPPRLLDAQVTVPLQAVILRCLEKPRDRRFASMEELAAALAAAQEAEAHGIEAGTRRRRVRRAVIALVAAGLLAAGAAATLLLDGRTHRQPASPPAASQVR